MSKLHTHYDTLQVVRNAGPEVIRAAYKSLSQRYHPDRHPPEERHTLEQRMKALNAAYATLSDPDRRNTYDELLAAREHAQQQTQPHTQTSQEPSPVQSVNRSRSKPLVTWRDWLTGFTALGCLLAAGLAWETGGPILVLVGLALLAWLFVRALRQQAPVMSKRPPKSDNERALEIAWWITLVTWGGMAAISTPRLPGGIIGVPSMLSTAVHVLAGFAPIYVGIRGFTSKTDAPYIPPWKRIIAALLLMSAVLTISLAVLLHPNLTPLPQSLVGASLVMANRVGIVLGYVLVVLLLALCAFVAGTLSLAIYSIVMVIFGTPILYGRAVLVLGAGISAPLLVFLANWAP